MNIHVNPNDLRKAVTDSLSCPSEDIARHVLAMAGANPNHIEKSITTGTGLVAYDLQAPAKNLVSIGPAIYGAHNSGGYLYWPCGDPHCANVAHTTLADVWLQPRPVMSAASAVWTYGLVKPFAGAISLPGLPIDGHVSLGSPPGGDFAPAAGVGPNYHSPGYAPAS